MSPGIALAVIAVLLLAVSLLGLLLKQRSARARSVVTRDPVDPAELGADRLGAAGTIVQFSTEYCARCPGTKRLLSELVDSETGVTFVHVDVTHSPRLTKKYQLFQTPTVLFVDAEGQPRTRVSGVLSRNTLLQELKTLTGGAQ